MDLRFLQSIPQGPAHVRNRRSPSGTRLTSARPIMTIPLFVPRARSLVRATHAFLADLAITKDTGTDAALNRRVAPHLSPDQWAVISAEVVATSKHWRRRDGKWHRLKRPRHAPPQERRA